jgi:quercetin dioxygenase-like cupin family protein
MKRGFTTKRAAELFLASVEVSKIKGEWVDPTKARTPVSEMAEEWFRAQVQVKPTTRSGYRFHLDKHVLRQTVIALHGGRQLDEHPSPGEATLYVLAGRVLLESEGTSWSGWTGDLLIIPNANHTLKALEDSAVLLTVAKLI